jgi:hypothetical protein
MLYAISFNKKEETIMEKLKKLMITVFVVGIFLVPVVSIAGDLEPSAAPAPTMKTLDQIPPTWSQKLPAAQRFEVVLDGFAVLDKETGLVWQKVVSTFGTSWELAISACTSIEVGGRKGWHLPTVEQLASLVDTSVSGAPKLPSGHPFSNVPTTAPTWSATTGVPDITNAWSVSFGTGFMAYAPKTYSLHWWCVRGGQSHDTQ